MTTNLHTLSSSSNEKLQAQCLPRIVFDNWYLGPLALECGVSRNHQRVCGAISRAILCVVNALHSDDPTALSTFATDNSDGFSVVYTLHQYGTDFA